MTSKLNEITGGEELMKKTVTITSLSSSVIAPTIAGGVLNVLQCPSIASTQSAIDNIQTQINTLVAALKE